LFGVAPPPQQTVVIFPPEYLPPPQSTMFQPYTITVTNAVQTLPLWTFQVPRSSILIIKDLDIYATNTTTATQVVFSLLVNGAPYPGYGQMNIFAAVAAMNARSFNDLTLRFTEGQTVQMQVQNIDGGNYQVAAGAQGWMYPRVIGEKYANAVGL
jgi:hypothetical protein